MASLRRFAARCLGQKAYHALKRFIVRVRCPEILGYLDIDGWLTFREARGLYETAKALPEHRPVVVEIGSWQGKSSLVLAKGLAQKRSPVLYCIDPFNASGDAASRELYAEQEPREPELLLDRFVANMTSNGVWAMVVLKQGMSHTIVGDFSDAIDLLFIDGDHDYEGVLRDFNEWSPFVKAGGLIAFHDVGIFAGVTRAVEEHVLKRGLYEETRRADSLLVVAKRP